MAKEELWVLRCKRGAWQVQALDTPLRESLNGCVVHVVDDSALVATLYVDSRHGELVHGSVYWMGVG